LNEGIFRTIETENAEKTIQKYIKNLEAYIKWLQSTSKNEVLAHWTTIYESSAYPKCKVTILQKSPFIYQEMLNFIKELRL
jgi:hypothetical protein